MAEYTRKCFSCLKNEITIEIPFIGLNQEQVNSNDEIILSKLQVMNNNIDLTDDEKKELDKTNSYSIEVDWYEECGECGSGYVRDSNGNIPDELQ